MKKAFSIPIAWLLISLNSLAQTIPGERRPLPGEEEELLAELNINTTGIPRVETMLKLGAYYLYLPGEEKVDLNRAKLYASQARELSTVLDFKDGYNESMVLTGNIFNEEGNTDSSQIIFEKALIGINRLKEFSVANRQPLRQIRALRQLASVHTSQNDCDAADYVLTEILKLYQANGLKNTHYIYERFTVNQITKGNWNRALYYALEMMRNMEITGDNSSAPNFYLMLGFIYRQIGQFQKAIDCFKTSLSFFKKHQGAILYELGLHISEATTKLNKAEEGVLLVQNLVKEFPPVTDFENRLVETSLGTCYRVLKRYDLAEIHFLKLESFRDKDKPIDIWWQRTMGQLYTEWGKYEKARPYLENCLKFGNFPIRSLAHLHFLFYKIDSAAGNYLSAMEHLMKNKELDDAVYTETKVRENRELQIKYETEKKDQDIRIKEQNILLLKRQSQLQQKDFDQARLRFQFDSITKHQNLLLLNSEAAKKDEDLLVKQHDIELLKKQDLLKQSSLKQANLIKNLTFTGLGLLVIILILLYNQFRIKQLNNQEMKEKNLSLQHLVDEKEWLLKEVHHRVKNNLHTVMSLLETQSAYLKDDALAAIQNSQHRVYAMSLIHQKLYQLENFTNVDMSVYLPELIDYLRDSFDVPQRVRFRSKIENIHLDISKAIPVGLILNEAVTNSIKYAFPGNASGEIQVEMKRVENGLINLRIIDSGTGFPLNSQQTSKNTFGLKLIKGLSDDIQGKFTIEQSHGTRIQVEFPVDLVAKNQKQKENIHIAALSS